MMHCLRDANNDFLDYYPERNFAIGRDAARYQERKGD